MSLFTKFGIYNSIKIVSLFNLEYTLDNPNDYGTPADDNFGYITATCESYSIVGAYLEDDADGTSSGKAYIFDNSNGNLLWTLDNPNDFGGASTDDRFARTVAITESYSIVGAPYERKDSDVNSGKAYIFKASS